MALFQFAFISIHDTLCQDMTGAVLIDLSISRENLIYKDCVILQDRKSGRYSLHISKENPEKRIALTIERNVLAKLDELESLGANLDTVYIRGGTPAFILAIVLRAFLPKCKELIIAGAKSDVRLSGLKERTDKIIVADQGAPTNQTKSLKNHLRRFWPGKH